ncbi:MAG: hypothetical protein H0U69_02825 [Trueperaceae bacterium]|nr:hypothetical protein [Trueperaceae bacterium]
MVDFDSLTLPQEERWREYLVDDTHLLNHLNEMGVLADGGNALGTKFRALLKQGSVDYGLMLSRPHNGLGGWIRTALFVDAHMRAKESFRMAIKVGDGVAGLTEAVAAEEKAWLDRVMHWKATAPEVAAALEIPTNSGWTPYGLLQNVLARPGASTTREFAPSMSRRLMAAFASCLKSARLSNGVVAFNMPIEGWTYYLLALMWEGKVEIRKCEMCPTVRASTRMLTCSGACRRAKSRAARKRA